MYPVPDPSFPFLGIHTTLRMDGSGSVATLGVPRSAVLQTGERSLVFVKAGNGQLQPREVKVGAEHFDRISQQAMATPWVPRNPRKIDGPAQVREILDLAA